MFTCLDPSFSKQLFIFYLKVKENVRDAVFVCSRTHPARDVDVEEAVDFTVVFIFQQENYRNMLYARNPEQ